MELATLPLNPAPTEPLPNMFTVTVSVVVAPSVTMLPPSADTEPPLVSAKLTPEGIVTVSLMNSCEPLPIGIAPGPPVKFVPLTSCRRENDDARSRTLAPTVALSRQLLKEPGG